MLNRFHMILVFTLKRIAAQPGLALAALAGLTIAAALAMSISIYVDAVYYRAFIDKLTQAEESRPPFTFGLSYTSGSDATWDEVQRVDSYLSEGAAAELGLAPQYIVEQFKTGTYGLYPRDAAQFNAESLVGRLRFGYINGMNDHITLLEGDFPAESTAADAPIEALVTQKTAADFDLQAGEHFSLVLGNAMQIPVRIAGVWQANDPNEDFWFTAPTVLYDFLLVNKADFARRIAPILPGNAYVGEWFLVMNGDQVDYSAAVGLIANINGFENTIETAFTGLRMMISPRIELQEYIDNAQVLTVQLYAFGLPIIGLLLAFISLTAALAIEGRRNEIAMLRSRGATLSQMVNAAIFEAILLGAAALLIAIPLSLLLAGLIGRSRSFLDFSSEADLRLMPTIPALIFGILVLILAIFAQIIPTIGAARHTVTSYKQNRSRLTRRPWWQRAWLDVLLFIPAAYGSYLMAQEGNLGSRNPFENPLLFLVPALGILALTLFVLRLLPIFITILAWITAQTRSVAILMASRRFARAPGAYTMPLILLVLTLSLSAFTAALAETLNHHLNDAAYYETGADAKFLDFGTKLDTPDLASRYSFVATAQYLGPNAYTAARVGQYTSRIAISGGTYTGKFLAVDRYEFPQVAFWRSDFASKDLGTLMNELASSPDAALAPREFMAANALTIGDRVTVTVESRNDGIRLDVPLTIVGDFDLFPTWYPSEGPLFVANLDTLFERAGGDFPYHVWFDAAPEFRRNQINVVSQHIAMISPRYDIYVEERRPERQGLFGLLSVGFLGAAVLTAVGFLLYVLFSFRQRFIEIGMLRAIGLSMRQLAVLLIAELASVILTGALIGTVLGICASLFFIPYLQVDSGVPPFVVEIAWPAVLRIYILFSWLFAIALGALAFALRRMKLFQAIKMGETA